MTANLALGSMLTKSWAASVAFLIGLPHMLPERSMDRMTYTGTDSIFCLSIGFPIHETSSGTSPLTMVSGFPSWKAWTLTMPLLS